MLATHRKQNNPFIENAMQELHFYKKKLDNHPITKLCQEKLIPEKILKEFAKIQLVDSAFWVPMLSLIKGKITAPRLLEAVRSNIICETGINGTPHITLCKQFVESLGITPTYGDYQQFSKHSVHPIDLTLCIQELPDAMIAGWLLAEEALVPILFQIFRAAYATHPHTDMGYLDEHIAVDADEHALWMQEAVEELLIDNHAYDQVIAGIDFGARKTLCIPDALYSELMRCNKN